MERKYKEYVKKGKRGELRIFREINAKDLWKKMLRSLFETGHPWITFKDPSNIRYSNQHTGVVHSSNLCTEILFDTKPTTYHENSRRIKQHGETAVCNLGSVNLKNHITVDENGTTVVNYTTLKKMARHLIIGDGTAYGLTNGLVDDGAISIQKMSATGPTELVLGDTIMDAPQIRIIAGGKDGKDIVTPVSPSPSTRISSAAMFAFPPLSPECM